MPLNELQCLGTPQHTITQCHQCSGQETLPQSPVFTLVILATVYCNYVTGLTLHWELPGRELFILFVFPAAPSRIAIVTVSVAAIAASASTTQLAVPVLLPLDPLFSRAAVWSQSSNVNIFNFANKLKGPTNVEIHFLRLLMFLRILAIKEKLWQFA